MIRYTKKCDLAHWSPGSARQEDLVISSNNQYILSGDKEFGGGFESLNIQSERPGTTLSPSGHDHTARFSFFVGYDSRDEIPETRQGWGQKGQGIFLHIGAFEKPMMTRKRVR